MSPSTSVRDRVTALDSAITELTDRAARAAEHLARLDAQIEQSTRRMARGSMDVSADAAEAARIVESKAPAPVTLTAPLTTEERLEAALRGKIATLTDLGKSLRLPMKTLAGALEKLRKAGRAANIGSEIEPRWTLIVGDECSADELRVAVSLLISDRPMTFKELLAWTGARRGRISGQIVDLQRTGRPVVNMGTERRARWFLPVKAAK